MAAALGTVIGSSAQADMILEQYEFQGRPGTDTTLAPSLTATGLTGLSFAEGTGQTPSTGSNSMSSTGWNNPGAYYSFGFTVNAAQSVTVDQIILTTRSSATGPGTITVAASVDGAALISVASITQGSAVYNDEFLSIVPVTARKSLTFYLVAANQVAANGAAVAATGTFRVGDYNPAGTPTPFTLNGTITPVAAVPEPAALALTTLGLISAALATRIRRPR